MQELFIDNIFGYGFAIPSIAMVLQVRTFRFSRGLPLETVALSILLIGASYNVKADDEYQYCSIDKRGSCSESAQIPSPHDLDHDQSIDTACYRAAVLEHQRIDQEDVKETVDSNLEVFKRVANIASKNHVNILVFPEDGLFIGNIREDVVPVLTEIPDPEKLESTNDNPCLQPTFYESSYILRNLSCIARENNLYVVANFGTKETCKPYSKIGSQTCPECGYLTLNTDVVLDSDGRFIKRYRKHNIFIEIFQKAPTLEKAYFDSPYGRFGIFTCFDLIFKSPAIDLVEQFNIETIIFPTWWYDELPILTAIQYQDGWSWTQRVNFIGANIQRPSLGSTGSGIFSGYNTVYTGVGGKTSKLVIGNLPKEPLLSSECSRNFNPAIVDVETHNIASAYKYKHYELLPSDSITPLDDNQRKLTQCSGQVCCTLDYRLRVVGQRPKYVLIIRDSRRPGPFEWYEQVCFVAVLESDFKGTKLDEVRFSSKAHSEFETIALEGTFGTKYVYPIAGHEVSELISRRDRTFNCDQQEDNKVKCRLEYMGNPKPIYAFGLYGRLYEGDKVMS